MRTIFVPKTQTNLTARAAVIRNQSKTLLSDYSLRQLIKYKFVSPIGTFVPVLVGPTAEIRKTLVRLKTMFFRAIEKRVPYIAYTETEFLSIVSRQVFEVKIVSRPQLFEGDYKDFRSGSIQTAQNSIKASKFGKSLLRYTTYLQEECLKHGVPLKLTPRFSRHLTDREEAKLSEMTVGDLPDYIPEIQYKVVIEVEIVFWRNLSYDATFINGSSSSSAALSFDEFVKNSNQIYKANTWTSSSILNTQPSNFVTRYRRHSVPEKLFYYIPQIIKVLTTLTRKTHYVSSAFSIGADEST